MTTSATSLQPTTILRFDMQAPCFLFIGLCFLLSSLPMMLSLVRRDHARTSA